MMRSIFFVGALATSLACATAGTTASGVRSDPNLITEAEVTASNGGNAYEVISRARPIFLKSRGSTSFTARGSEFAKVYVNSQPYGEISSLSTINVNQIKEIRYYSSSEAVSKFGGQLGTGVIQIITR